MLWNGWQRWSSCGFWDLTLWGRKRRRSCDSLTLTVRSGSRGYCDSLTPWMDVNFSCTSAENFCFACSLFNAFDELIISVKSFEETCYATNALIEEKIGQQLERERAISSAIRGADAIAGQRFCSDTFSMHVPRCPWSRGGSWPLSPVLVCRKLF
ncbi:hypothetical protein EJB05_04988, partial [Eragrostis curvula]